QRSREAWLALGEEAHREPAIRTGLAFGVAIPLGCALLLIFAVLMDIAMRVDWFRLDEDFESWILRKLIDTLLCLAIVCGYWRGRAESMEPVTDRTPREMLRSVAWIALGGVLLILMLLGTAGVFNMVYTALDHYVFDYQPTLWAGRHFAPAQ